MKQTIFTLITFFISLSQGFAADYAPLTEQEAVQFDAEMNKAIAKAEANVTALEQNATRHDLAPTWNAKLELQNAIIQLEVKKTLVGNFRNTESLASPLVRRMLLSVLNKDIITTADLADLQSTVLEEKAKIRAARAKSPAASSTTTELRKK